MVCNRRHSEKVEIYVGQNRFQKAKRKTARIFFVYIGSGKKKECLSSRQKDHVRYYA